MSNSNSLKEEDPASPGDDNRIVMPLLGEEMSVTKQTRETGLVRVTTITHQHEELVDELLAREQVEVERIAVGKAIASMPPVREEGNTIVIPVVEEVLLIERRLVLKEEVRIRRVHGTERHQERVTLRKQEAVITRLPVETSTVEASSISNDRPEDHIQENK